MNTERKYVSAGSIATTDLQTPPSISFLRLRVVDGKSQFTQTTPLQQRAAVHHALSQLSISEMDTMADFVFGSPETQKGGSNNE
ncbi:hypothetical protein [Larkinella sp. C7]|uniref:hypothetical protein n=1 Tax=Larkinella sp. C7 TaxID=2576607 RepID=UPI0011114A6D|nr:hypothetical protein [Larkinella sp. C7]